MRSSDDVSDSSLADARWKNYRATVILGRGRPDKGKCGVLCNTVNICRPLTFYPGATGADARCTIAPPSPPSNTNVDKLV